MGNPALAWNCEKHEGRVLGIFCFDRAFLSRPDFSVNRFGFYLKALGELRKELRQAGGDLLVLDTGPDQSFASLLKTLQEQSLLLPSAWSWNRDYEPFAIARDARIKQLLENKFQIDTHTERDHLLIEPAELFKADERGSFYQVFTPFSKKWLQLFESSNIQQRLSFQKTAAKQPLHFSLTWKDLKAQLEGPLVDVLEEYTKRVGAKVTIALPPAGEHAARERLKRFKAQAFERYERDRDFPAVAGTSQLAIDLKNGSLTTAQIIAWLGLKPGSKFLSELIWREFYFHILTHVPRVETTAFNLKYQNIAWADHPEHLAAWKAGKTGFPLVDAGMRQLNATGWMHNRVRMVVASFLTKDLHCNWQHGERYFMEQLLDGDLAPNNGGWQWAASTGCDPQPYFRIFNPTLQSKRFDPEGQYIKQWVPELRSLSLAQIHEPWAKGDPGVDYPRPIVEHSVQARKAVELYKQVR